MIFNLFKKKPEYLKPDWSELYLQAKENVQYLRSHIKMLSARIEDLKARSIRNNREKIISLAETRAWMQRKLQEEELEYSIFKIKKN